MTNMITATSTLKEVGGVPGVVAAKIVGSARATATMASIEAVTAARGGGGVGEDGGGGEGDGDDAEHRGVDAGYGRGEGLGAVLEAAEQQARAEHEEHVAADGGDDRGLDHGRQARGGGDGGGGG